MSNLTDNLKSLVTGDMVHAASVALGEKETSVARAFDGIMPALLTGLLNAPSQTHASVSEKLLQAGADPNIPAGIVSGLAAVDNSSASLDMGRTLSAAIFENNHASIANLISNFAGIKSSSSTTLLAAGAALAASFLGQKMKAENLSFNSILAWLGQHKEELASAMPGSLAATVKSTTGTPGHDSRQAETAVIAGDTVKRNKWLFPLILLALIGIGLFWWLKGCNESGGDADPQTTAVIDSAGKSIDDALNNASNKIDSAVTTVSEAGTGKLDSAGNWIVARGDSVSIKLDNGTEISTFKGALEDRFYAFIKDPAAVPGKDLWFNFDELLFESGKATLKKGYEKQLANTAEILKAYPEVKVKIGAYTDNTGDSLKNVRLSESRAKAVYNQLISKGLTRESFDEKPYEGYGPQHPVADNSTPEGRAQNRRVSLSIRAK